MQTWLRDATAGQHACNNWKAVNMFMYKSLIGPQQTIAQKDSAPTGA